MDFRMDKESWISIVLMIVILMYFIAAGAGGSLTMGGYLQAFLYALLTTLVLIALCCIPVLLYCYFIKKIPDIDYSVNLASALVVVGLIADMV